MNNTCFSFQYNSDLEFPLLRIILSVVLGITSVSAVSLNSLVLYSMWKNPSLHKPSYLLLANLALSDLLFGGIEEPLMIFRNLTYIKKWRRLVCHITTISHPIGYWLASVSLYSLTLTSIDRLLAIRLKNRYRSFVTSRRIWMVTVPYWVGMFLLSFILLLTNYARSVAIVAPCFLFVFLTIITVCYSMAFYSLKKLTSSVSSSSQQPPDNGTNTFDVSQYRRSMNTMILVMLTTILLYLPYFGSSVTFSLIQAGGNSYYKISYKGLSISSLMIAMNSSLNPLLCLWRISDIRQAVKTTVKRILRREHHSVHVVQTCNRASSE